MFAPDEYLEMVIMYGECNRNTNEATRQYAIRFPQRNHPSSNAFLRLMARAGTTGSLMPQKKGLVAENVINSSYTISGTPCILSIDNKYKILFCLLCLSNE
jgi:hypothetical protein